MRVECPRCTIYGRRWSTWRATGQFVTKGHGKPFIAAELACEAPECRGRTWTSGLHEAVDAGQAVRVANGEAPYTLDTPPKEIADLGIQPSFEELRQRGDFAPIGSIAHDWKQRQTGEDGE